MRNTPTPLRARAELWRGTATVETYQSLVSMAFWLALAMGVLGKRLLVRMRPMPAIEFQEVKYTNLRIKGDVVTPQVDKAILGPTPKDAVGKDPNSDPYLDEWLTSDTFLGNVKNQDARIADNPRAPDFARARFRRKPGKCTVECALVSTIDNVPSQYRTAGHVIEVPGFGNVFVGELSVGRHFDLNMIRLELEHGIFTLGGPGVNGKIKP